MSELWTVGKVAQDLNVPEHRIHYLFRARKIPDVRKVGGRRLFTAGDVRRVAEALGLRQPGVPVRRRKHKVQSLP